MNDLDDLIRVWELAAAWRSVHPDNTSPESSAAVDAVEKRIDANATRDSGGNR